MTYPPLDGSSGNAKEIVIADPVSGEDIIRAGKKLNGVRIVSVLGKPGASTNGIFETIVEIKTRREGGGGSGAIGGRRERTDSIALHVRKVATLPTRCIFTEGIWTQVKAWGTFLKAPPAGYDLLAIMLGTAPNTPPVNQHGVPGTFDWYNDSNSSAAEVKSEFYPRAPNQTKFVAEGNHLEFGFSGDVLATTDANPGLSCGWLRVDVVETDNPAEIIINNQPIGFTCNAWTRPSRGGIIADAGKEFVPGRSYTVIPRLIRKTTGASVNVGAATWGMTMTVREFIAIEPPNS